MCPIAMYRIPPLLMEDTFMKTPINGKTNMQKA